MSESVAEWFHNVSGKVFAVQFVVSVHVVDSDESVMEIKSYLIPATSEKAAREAAQREIDLLSDGYRNREGEVVNVRCEGIHKVEELDYVNDDGYVQLPNFLFSTATRLHHLIQEGPREDLPLLDQ